MSEAAPRWWHRALFWDFPRASLPYEILVTLILAFIFLTPRALFRDQPRPRDLVMLPAAPNANVWWIEPELLRAVPEGERAARAEALLRGRSGRAPSVLRVEPIHSPASDGTGEGEVRGYLAYTRR